jgi:chorismate lyase/3-hydroxybenzoate synthase
MQLTFVFGQPETGLIAGDETLRVHLRNQVITGAGSETWNFGTLQYHGANPFGIHRFESQDQLCLAVMAPVTQPSIREISRTLYAELARQLGSYHFYRIWNFVPEINRDYGELDTYKLFCLGRGEALEAVQHTPLPAASAVGTPGGQLVIVVLGGRGDVLPVENPLQIPAYRYPERYGPRSPSFARATRIDGTELYVSGTASIRQSESLHQGDVAAQFALAMENVEVVIRAAGLHENPDSADHTHRIYVRDPEDWQTLQDHPAVDPGRFSTLNVIQAEICRPELLIEVETYLSQRRAGAGRRNLPSG